jgi:hypothetical protein
MVAEQGRRQGKSAEVGGEALDGGGGGRQRRRRGGAGAGGW